jgi:hypothetical protein
MKVKMILPALTEAISPYFRPIKYSLFPPLGLAALAGYLNEDDQVTIQDEHVEKQDLNDDPELVVIQVYLKIRAFVLSWETGSAENTAWAVRLPNRAS